MSWLTSHWRLKLLAVGLSLILLGAVAFSENPLTGQSRTVPITYEGLPPNLILIQPPTSVTVNLVGFAQTLHQMGQGSVSATVDASRLKHDPGTAPVIQEITVVPHVLTAGVTSQADRISLSVTVDDKKTVQLPITVKTPNVSEGWKVTKTQVQDSNGNVAHENVSGPASQVNGLKAFVEVASPIENDVIDTPSGKVRFLNASNKEISWPPQTLPASTADPDVVTVHLEAKRPNQSRQVFVRAGVSGQPAVGYQITNVLAAPALLVISGPADIISRLDSLNLRPVSIQGITSDHSYTIPLNLPRGVTSDQTSVTVQVQVQQIPQPAPPSPSPSPSP